VRRFDDTLRIFCSIVLGAVLRDADSMAQNFEAAFREAQPLRSLAHLLAQATTVALILLLLRTIHGSACFDLVGTGSAGSNSLGKPPSRSSLTRRIANQLLTLAALFIYPVAAAHFLARHEVLPTSDVALFFLLFGSFLVYIVWDVMLWTDDVDSVLDSASKTWIRLNGYVILAIVSVIVAHVVHVGGGVVPARVVLIVGFVTIVPLVVVADYWLNREFYFPQER